MSSRVKPWQTLVYIMIMHRTLWPMHVANVVLNRCFLMSLYSAIAMESGHTIPGSKMGRSPPSLHLIKKHDWCLLGLISHNLLLLPKYVFFYRKGLWHDVGCGAWETFTVTPFLLSHTSILIWVERAINKKKDPYGSR